MRTLVVTGILLATLSGRAFSQDISQAMQAWKGGFVSREFTVMKDGKRCSYAQTAQPANNVGHMTVGFSSPGCTPSEKNFQFPISRVRISKQGLVCVVECINGDACLRGFPWDSPIGTSVTIYEALPGSCEALAAAVSRIAPQAEAALKAEEDKAERQRLAVQAEVESRLRAKEDLSARRQAALADCGSSPTISGGPWFSSTYKTAVQVHWSRAQPLRRKYRSREVHRI